MWILVSRGGRNGIGFVEFVDFLARAGEAEFFAEHFFKVVNVVFEKVFFLFKCGDLLADLLEILRQPFVTAAQVPVLGIKRAVHHHRCAKEHEENKYDPCGFQAVAAFALAPAFALIFARSSGPAYTARLPSISSMRRS